MTNEEVESLKLGLQHLSQSLKNEQQSVFWGGVDAIEAEMVAAAADRALVRAARARERLYDELAAQLPPPRETPPVALQSAPAQPYVDPFDEPFRSPRFMTGDGLPPAEVGRYGE